MRDLTPRQRQIAEGLARGLSYAEIAGELGLSEGTVKNYAAAAAARLPNPRRLNPQALLKMYVEAA